MNLVCMIGNLGKDPEITTFQDGNKEAKFNIACKKGETTHWFECKAVGKQVDSYIVPYIKKGTKVEICGELRTNSWETKEGQKRTGIYIYVKEISILMSPKDTEEAPMSPKDTEEAPTQENKPSSDLPPSQFDDLPF